MTKNTLTPFLITLTITVSLITEVKSNIGCQVDQCKVCANSTTSLCSKCEEGFYLKTFYSSEKQSSYNDCWSKNKLFIAIGSLILGSLLFCCLIWMAYKKGLKVNSTNKQQVEESNRAAAPPVVVKGQREAKMGVNGANKENIKGLENMPQMLSTERHMIPQETLESQRNLYVPSTTPTFSKENRKKLGISSVHYNLPYNKRNFDTRNNSRMISPRENGGRRIVKKIVHPPKLKHYSQKAFGLQLKKSRNPDDERKFASPGNSVVCMSPEPDKEGVFESFGSDKNQFSRSMNLKMRKPRYITNHHQSSFNLPGSREQHFRSNQDNYLNSGPQETYNSPSKPNTTTIKLPYSDSKRNQDRIMVEQKIEQKTGTVVSSKMRLNQSELKPVLSPSLRDGDQRNKTMMHTSLVLSKNNGGNRNPALTTQRNRRKGKKILQHVVEFELGTDSKQFNTTPKKFAVQGIGRK